MKTVSHKIAESLYLVRQECAGASKPKAQPRMNHVAAIDVSGSMAYDLPKLRADLKAKLPTLLAEGDTLSLVWFSGRGQTGILFEGEEVATLTDLKRIEGYIDRWLKPCSLTGFVEPLVCVETMAARLATKFPKNETSLFFMSDGMDNQWPREQVLQAVERAAVKLASVTIVEYGFYADRQLLAAMAARSGGSLLFAKDFASYAPVFDGAMKKRSGAARLSVNILGDPVDGLVFSIGDGELVTYASEGQIVVASDVAEVYYLASSPAGTEGKPMPELYAKGREHEKRPRGLSRVAYAAVSLFSVRCRPKIVKALLGALGDVRLIDDFARCYGKQAYSVFMESAKGAAFDPVQRWSMGHNPKRVPRDDAFTVLDMLELLASDDENVLLVDHPRFQVDRIGRKRIPRESALTDEEEAQVDKLRAELALTRDGAKIATISQEIAKISNKPVPLKFVAKPLPDGVPINGLVFNESTPNVSLRVRREGHVDIKKRLEAETSERAPWSIPDLFPTFQYRNAAIIKDGLLNVEKLPMRLSQKTMEKLFELHGQGRIADSVVKQMIELVGTQGSEETVTYVDFGALPLCNGATAEHVSAEKTFDLEWCLVQVQARQKVYKQLLSEVQETRLSASFVRLYSQAGADFLRDLGFTDYSGFGPKTVQDVARDYYMCKTLDISLKGFASLPSWKEFQKALAEGKKLGPAMLLMKGALDEVDKQRARLGAHKDKLAGWLKAEERARDVERRPRLIENARAGFSLGISEGWLGGEAEIGECKRELVCTTPQGQMFAGVLGKAVTGEEKVEL